MAGSSSDSKAGAFPGWIRAIPRDRDDEQQQQAQRPPPQQALQMQSPPSHGFASSLSAFFPRSTAPSGGALPPPLPDASGNAGDLQMGDYPLFTSRRTVPVLKTGLNNPSSPFAYSSGSSPGAAVNSPLAFTSSPMFPQVSQSMPSAMMPPLAGHNFGGNTSARLRRPSVLATSSLAGDLAEEADDRFGQSELDYSPPESRLGSVSIDGQDELSAMSEDVDMDSMEINSAVLDSRRGATSGLTAPKTAAIMIPSRARSHSQSSSVMASSAQLARSPSAWPNSPPRSGFTPSANPQHLLARLTSEQQQAMAASASSASSACYMIPTPYRQALNGGTSGDDLLLGGGRDTQETAGDEVEHDDVEPLMTSDSPGSSRRDSRSSRSFNPLNPYSERRPTGTENSLEEQAEAMRTEDSQLSVSSTDALNSIGFQQQRQDAFSLAGNIVPGPPTIRGSRSTPALKDLNSSTHLQRTQPPANFVEANEAGMTNIPFPPSESTIPTTPPQNVPQTGYKSTQPARSSLRRSQSASHRPAELFNLLLRNPSPSANRDSELPLTAPAESSAFRFQRANSLSDIPRLQRQQTFGESSLSPKTPFGGLEDSSGSGSGKGAADSAMNTISSDSNGRHPSHSSGSDSPNGGPRVVRRVVNHKKGSLMPKSKDHLRTMAQLRLETGEFEVASEAALHRISQSSAAVPGTPSRRNTPAAVAAVPSPFASLPRAPGLGYSTPVTAGGPSGSAARPTSSRGGKLLFPNPVKNRFPETVDDEEDEEPDSSASEPDYASATDMGQDPASASDTGGTMLIGEDEDISSNAGEGPSGDNPGAARSAWMLRDPAQAKPITPGSAGRQTNEMDLSPSSAMGWSAMTASARPGKRKFNDSDRFEPYNAAFKRRAVSPASASSVSLSPLLSTRELQGSAIPVPPPALTALGPAAQISSALQGQGNSSSVPPSPVISGGGTWLNPNKSRANSPAASVALSTNPAKRWPEEEKERKGVDLSKMSLG